MTHIFICENESCGHKVYDMNTRGVHTCPKCGTDMYWNLKDIGISDGDYHHTSDSLAFHPDDIAEHRRLFPGVEVTAEGQPMFTSTRQQERYAERCGFHKKQQRSRRLGRQRIA